MNRYIIETEGNFSDGQILREDLNGTTLKVVGLHKNKSPNSKRFELEQRKTEALEKMVSLNFGNGFDVEEKDGVVEVVAVDKQLTEEDVRTIVRGMLGYERGLDLTIQDTITRIVREEIDSKQSYADEVFKKAIRKFKQE